MARQRLEVPAGRAEITVGNRERFLSGTLASVSDFLFRNSELTIIFGALTSAALLGSQVNSRAANLQEATKLPLLLYRTTYTPGDIFDLFESLEAEGRAEYQYLNVLSTGVFPFVVATFLATCTGKIFDQAGLGHDWNLFPFVFAIAATVEHIGISYLLWDFPRFNAGVAAVVGMTAGLKTRFFWYTLILLLVGLLWLAKKAVLRLFRKKHE